jgi:succinate dehydrogenase / fumarate reductase, flavoprotein subunit
VQFHPTGMVWPPSVRGILVTEGVRGDGGVLRNADGERFMFRYIPEMFRAETAETEEEADRWYADRSARRTPDLLPRDEVARAINTEIKEGRGSPHGGVYLDIATRRGPEYITRRLPGMHHQFLELADVDITKEPMEVGPTCHYMMGGVRVDAETQASTMPGLFAAGEVAGGMHGANRLGGNSLSDLLVFGQRAGRAAAEYAGRPTARPVADTSEVEQLVRRALQPFEATGTENPYAIQQDLQECMQTMVGIIRTEDELTKAVDELAVLRERARRVRVEGHRQYNPGWHLALDLDPLLAVSECIARAALERKESRGAQTREDFPDTDPALAQVNVVVRQRGGELKLNREQLPAIPDELQVILRDA